MYLTTGVRSNNVVKKIEPLETSFLFYKIEIFEFVNGIFLRREGTS